MTDITANELEYISSTQTLLGAVISRPPLSTRLLARPPFRFLRDIIINVIANTGYFIK